MSLIKSAALVLALHSAAVSQMSMDAIRENWSKPVEPYHVAGNIYYVGASGVSSHIIDTGDGLILMDTGTTIMTEQIPENIEALGYEPGDVKIILSSHAHWDHVEGHAEMRRATGAEIFALGKDAQAIASGIDNSALGGDGWTPAPVDRVLEHGDTVALGETVLTAHHTPGHTKGCTTWTMQVEENGKTCDVVFIGGTSINIGVNLIGNTRHPTIAEDYATTFERLRGLECDVFIAQHPFMYGMQKKMEAKRAGEKQNPFIDTEGYRAFVAAEEQKYRDQLERERASQP